MLSSGMDPTRPPGPPSMGPRMTPPRGPGPMGPGGPIGPYGPMRGPPPPGPMPPMGGPGGRPPWPPSSAVSLCEPQSWAQYTMFNIFILRFFLLA